MKWLKLDCDFRNDPKVRALGRQFGGLEAAGFWTLLLSYVGANGMPECEIRLEAGGQHSPIDLASFVGTKTNVLLRMIESSANLRLINAERWTNDRVIFIPNLLKRVDDYTRKVRTNSGQSPEKHAQKKKKKKKETQNAPIVPVNGDATSAYSEDFETYFWLPYPKKIGKGKAYEEWKRLNPANGTREKIRESITGSVNSQDWIREGGRFIPNPATWLHQRRFDDSITPAAPDRGPRLVL